MMSARDGMMSARAPETTEFQRNGNQYGSFVKKHLKFANLSFFFSFVRIGSPVVAQSYGLAMGGGNGEVVAQSYGATEAVQVCFFK